MTLIAAVFPAVFAVTGEISFNSIQDIGPLILLAAVLFAVELVFFLVPGVSVSSLVIAMACLYYPFWIVFGVALFPIFFAHFALRKDLSVIVPDFLTLLPMVAFGTFAGPVVLAQFQGFLGWSIYGASFSFVKWAVAIPVGIMTGRSMAKRLRELILEPAVSSLLFQLKSFFLFLFPSLFF